MKHYIITLIMICATVVNIMAQDDTVKTKQKLDEIVISAMRLTIPLENTPASVSVVEKNTLNEMPRSIAADEALRLVPGVKIDNQHDGERVHISIRGQGILTERGIRGIQIIQDGIPINDPSGFAPDLYDVDWATVKNIEVLRGPFASIYGGSGAAGVIYITTEDGGTKPLQGRVEQYVGSNAFWKSFAQLGGREGNVDYRVSFSHIQGDGSRVHQAFRGNNLYEKINFYPGKKLKLTQIVAYTEYFQQNPEGLNYDQLQTDPTQANPDAVPFNEYQYTSRVTLGLTGNYKINSAQSINAIAYLRPWRYKETSNKAAEYRDIQNPGMALQYNLKLKTGKIRHNFSLGTEFKSQTINMYKLKSEADPNRIDSPDMTNLESDSLLANQIISQQSLGTYLLYTMDLGKLDVMLSARYDKLDNRLQDKMLGADTASAYKPFDFNSFRAGLSYKFGDFLTLYTDYSQGFIPPSTEELANNPFAYYGFNTHLVASTAQSVELGARGLIADKVYYEVTGFIMNTQNDFFRFKLSERGNQEVFYGNAGDSYRQGVELYLRYRPVTNLDFQVAYTYSDFKYVSATLDPFFSDTSFVLTKAPAPGQWLPNIPKHQVYAEVDYTVLNKIRFYASIQALSKWAIYTDADAYAGLLDPAVYHNWQEGYVLYNAGVSYMWTLGKLNGELSIFGRNLTNEVYVAYTEPDPDGNSYQPGPGRELFAKLSVKF